MEKLNGDQLIHYAAVKKNRKTGQRLDGDESGRDVTCRVSCSLGINSFSHRLILPSLNSSVPQFFPHATTLSLESPLFVLLATLHRQVKSSLSSQFESSRVESSL